MDLFTYLMAKNGNNSSVHGDLFSYLLGKGQSQTYTVSGVTINIPDAKKLVSFMMTKESTQDGEPTPDNPVEVKTVKGYRNLLNLNNLSEQTSGGVTFTPVYKDGLLQYISATGTSTGSNYYLRQRSQSAFSAGTYRLSGCPSGGGSNSYYIFWSPSISQTVYDYGNGATRTFTQSETNIIYIGIKSGVTVNDLRFYPMLVEGNQQLPYVPYGNNYVNVAVSDGTNTNNYPIPLNNNELVGKSTNLDQLIVDKSGNVYINKIFAKIDSYNGETITTDYWSTTGGLDTGATIYYVMNEPQLIDLNTKVDIKLFKGVNNISNSEDGYMTIEYR